MINSARSPPKISLFSKQVKNRDELKDIIESSIESNSVQ